LRATRFSNRLSVGDAENPLGVHGVLIHVRFWWDHEDLEWRCSRLGSSPAVFDFPKQQNAGVGSDTSTFKFGKDLLGSEVGKLESLSMTRCHE
jgi:hypothetical protein